MPREKPIMIDSLDKLLDAIQHDAPSLPRHMGDLDWANLPTFGGSVPADTTEIWSWDEARLLVGTCVSDIEIISR